MKAFIEKLNKANARAVFVRAWKHAQLAVEDGMYEIVIRKAIKSREQEERYHAMIGDISKQYTHYGRKWDQEDLKRLLVDAFKHETKNDPDFADLWRQMGDLRLVPAIGRDGFVALGDQTRKFPSKLANAFIDWLFAFGNECDPKIVWTDPDYQSQMKQVERAA